MFKYGGFGILRAMNIKILQYGAIARMKEILLPPALRVVGIRVFVASRESKAPGIQARTKAFLEALLLEA